MGDVIVITVIVIAVFLILCGQIRKFRRGQCSGGCAGCSGCGSGCMKPHAEDTGNSVK